jgi:phage shock protein A
MGTFSRLRYVIAANVNSLLEKAEDPEKLLRALVREMEDASEEARVACAELLSEQQRLQRLETRLGEDGEEWQRRAEDAVSRGRDDLARTALKAKSELAEQHKAALEEQKHVAQRVEQMEQDMATLKVKLAEAKTRLKGMQAGKSPRQVNSEAKQRLSPGERKIKRAMERFDHLQTQVDNLEARVRSYEVGGTASAQWKEMAAEPADPAIEEELKRMKERLSAKPAADKPAPAEEGSEV